jgi:cytochrome P450
MPTLPMHRLQSWLGLRHLRAYLRDPLEFVTDIARAGGDVAHVRMLGRDFYLLSHPGDIERVLVEHAGDLGRSLDARRLGQFVLGQGLLTSDGALWRRQRKLMAAAFTPRRIHAYADTMDAIARAFIDRWSDGASLNLHDEMSRIAMRIVAEVLFGADVEADADRVGACVRAIDAFFSSPEQALDLPPWAPTPGNLRMHAARRRIDAIIYRIIAERRAGRGARPDAPEAHDLLDALLTARDDAGAAMTDQQIRDECVTLFLAGHETTALALVHALYLLARHPAIEARFHDEVAAVLGPPGSGVPSAPGASPGASPGVSNTPPASDVVARLPLTRRIIDEAMRLYPPAWAISREVQRPFELRGRRFEPGAQLVISQWVLHRDPRWFPEPERFDPDRWLPARATATPRMAYLPFGGGPRICIGNHFALTEAVLVLARMGQRFRVIVTRDATLAFRPSITLRPQGSGLRGRVIARAGSHGAGPRNTVA